MTWQEVTDYRYPQGWTNGAARARHYCEELEKGEIIYFNGVPYEFPKEAQEFLLSQKQSRFRHHKNISYRPTQDKLRGSSNDDPEDAERLHRLMRDYSRHVTEFLTNFLSPYAGKWTLDYASFRPLEEAGRDLSLHKRNDLMHVDAFPSRPTRGGRILRVFTNVNPNRPRVWETTGGFAPLAEKLAERAGMPKFAKSARSPFRPIKKVVGPFLKPFGVPNRSAYDSFMLRFHDYLKENEEYQTKWSKSRLEFPPFSTWMVYTDTVPHAVMSGQFALEQTYIVPLGAMVAPEHAPIRILETMCGCALGV